MLTTLALLVLVIVQTYAKVAFFDTSYSHGQVSVDVTTWSDAPAMYNVELVSGSGKSVILWNIPSVSGLATVSLPNFTPPGSYMLQAVSLDGSEVFTTTEAFTVSSSDFADPISSAAFAISNTRADTPLYTSSIITTSGTTSLGTFLLTPAPTPTTTTSGTATLGTATTSLFTTVITTSGRTVVSTGSVTLLSFPFASSSAGQGAAAAASAKARTSSASRAAGSFGSAGLPLVVLCLAVVL